MLLPAYKEAHRRVQLTGRVFTVAVELACIAIQEDVHPDNGRTVILPVLQNGMIIRNPIQVYQLIEQHNANLGLTVRAGELSKFSGNVTVKLDKSKLRTTYITSLNHWQYKVLKEKRIRRRPSN